MKVIIENKKVKVRIKEIFDGVKTYYIPQFRYLFFWSDLPKKFFNYDDCENFLKSLRGKYTKIHYLND